MMGLPFAPTRERFDLVEDTLELARQMWSGDESAFDGSQVQVARPISVPKPISRPAPRILIGGTGERRTLPLVARLADACNLFDSPDQGKTIRHKLEVLDKACRQIGRDPSEIETTVSARLETSEEAADLADRCRAFADWGIDHVVLITDGTWTVEKVETVGAAVDEVGGLRS